ncbi:MAG TPA: YfhO family protein [Thermoanaerobaculia bacterium]
MLPSAILLLLLAGCAALVGVAAGYLGRPLPHLYLGGFFLLAILPFPRAFISDMTVLPLDHAMYTRPWYVAGTPKPYNPYLNDVTTQILPWAKATRLAWKEQAMPLRDRWNGCGMPLAANSVSAAFSPLTFLALLLPLARSYTLISALKILLAASGMWLWTRELGATERSASFASVAYALSFSFTPPWLLFPQSAVLCLWPWMLFLIERCRDERGRGRALAALSALFVFTELAGHPETAVMGFLFAALWLAARWLCGDLPRPRRLFASIALAAALALGLTAFLLIPSIFAIASSGRIAAMSRPYWEPILSLAPHGPWWREAPTSFFPHTLGNGIGSPLLPVSGPSFAEKTLGYFGIIGWAAALLIVRPGSPRHRAEWILLGLLVCGFAISVGQWPFAEIFAHLPMIRFMFPHRFHSWEALAGAAIAALELDRLSRDLKTHPRAAAAGAVSPLLLGSAAFCVFLHFRGQHAAVGGYLFQKRQVLVILTVLGCAAVLAVVMRARPSLYVVGLTLLCAAELLYQWRRIFQLNSLDLLFPERPSIAYLHAQPGTFRVLGAGSTLFPSTNVFAGLEEIRTHDAIERRDYVEFLNATCGYPPTDYFKKIRDLNAPALDFLNVRYLLTEPGQVSPGEKWRPAYSGSDATIFENSRVLARASIPTRIRLVQAKDGKNLIVPDADAAFGTALREIVSIKDWRETAYVLSDRDAEVKNPAADVLAYAETTNRASFHVRVPSGTSEAFVVLSLVQDGGWSAQDESAHSVPVLPANGPFLAVALPAGDHRISMRYSPPGFATGLKISAITAALVTLAVFARKQRRHPAAPPLAQPTRAAASRGRP